MCACSLFRLIGKPNTLTSPLKDLVSDAILLTFRQKCLVFGDRLVDIDDRHAARLINYVDYSVRFYQCWRGDFLIEPTLSATIGYDGILGKPPD